MVSELRINQLKQTVIDLGNIDNMRPSHAFEQLTCTMDLIDDIMIECANNNEVYEVLEDTKAILESIMNNGDEDINILIKKLHEVLEMIDN